MPSGKHDDIDTVGERGPAQFKLTERTHKRSSEVIETSHTSTAPAVSSHESPESRDNSEPLATVNFKTRTIYDEKITLSEVLEAEAQREMDFLRSIKRTLLTSFMSGRGVNANGDGATEDAEEDILSVLNIPAFGNFTRMWIDVHFGDIKKRSGVCELLIDSGKRAMSKVYPFL